VFRRRVFEECGGFRSNVHSHEDWDFWLAAADRGFSFMPLRKPLFLYNVHSNSLTSRMRSKKKRIVAEVRWNNRRLYDEQDLGWATTVLPERGAVPNTGKRALLITDSYPPAAGETARFSESLAESLLKSGFAVDVATRYLEERHSYYHNGVNIYDFEWAGSHLQNPGSVSDAELDSFVEKGDYDLCIAAGDPRNRPIWAAGKCRSSKNIVIPLIDEESYRILRSETALRDRLNDCLRQPAALVCVRKSAYEAVYLLENQIPAVHLPYPTPFVAPVMDLRREMHIGMDRKVVLSLSPFLKAHGPRFEMIPDCVLIRMCPLTHAICLQAGAADGNTQERIPLGSLGPSHEASVMESADLLLLPERIDFVEAWISRAGSHRLPWVAAEGVLRTGEGAPAGGRVVPRDEMAQIAGQLLFKPVERQRLADEGFQGWNRSHRMERFLDDLFKRVRVSPAAPPSFSLVRNPIQPSRPYLKYLRSGQRGRDLVSVVIPTYNRPHQLMEAVSSVLGQTYPDLEIIVVNDHGVDVLDRLREFKDGRILYHRNESNRGLAACRNIGVGLAHGRYICYLDDDDLYYPTHVETLVQALAGSGREVAYSDSFQVVQTEFEGQWIRKARYLRYSMDFSRERLFARNIAPVNCFMHTRQAFIDAGGFDETLCVLEDWDLWIRMAMRRDFLHLREITCEVRLRVDGKHMSFERQNRYREATLSINRKHQGRVLELRDRQDKHSLRKNLEILTEFEAMKGSASPEQALAFLEEKLTREVLSPYLEYHCAQAYLERGYWEQAKAHLLRCLDLNPRDREALNDLAVVEYMHFNNADSALSCLERSLAIDPTHRDSRINLIDICLEKGLLARASEHLGALMNSCPGDPEALLRAERLTHKNSSLPPAAKP
jgi:glycosyltransferase involved in cell wall biosynthesis